MDLFYTIAIIIAVCLIVGSLIALIKDLQNRLRTSEDKYSKLLSQKKSGEVILGQISEHLAPFLENFGHDPKNCKFLGQPVDYICFDEDQVVFIEVKSGNSQMSPKQKNIRKLIESKMVRWEEFRIPPKKGHDNKKPTE